MKSEKENYSIMTVNRTNLKDYLILGQKKYKSRLLHCFGDPKLSINSPEMATALIELSETDFITIYTHGKINDYKSIEDFPIGYAGLKYYDLKQHLNTDNYTILINTNHALTSEEAIERSIKAAKCANSKMIKLEVLNNKRTKPINNEVFKSAKVLIEKGYDILPIIDKGDIECAKQLEKIGCLCVRVLMNDISTEKGFTDFVFFKELREAIEIPIIAEGGLRTPQDAYNAMVLGVDGILVNRAIFSYDDPLFFIKTIKESVISGRNAYLCSLIRKS